MATIQYTPPPTVKEFIKHYRPGELFFDWIVGPVGSGKTTGIFFKLAYMAGLQAPSPIDGIRRSRCVIVRSTMPQLRDTTIKSFNYWFKDGQAGKWFATEKNFLLKFGDVECEVLFRPLDTPDDVDRVLSLEVTFAIIDEFVQIPQEIVEALSARCGRYPPEIEGGATNWGMWGASNPGMEDQWWYAFLEDQDLLEPGQDPSNWLYFKQPSGNADGSKKYDFKVAENLANLPGKDKYYENLAKGKTEHWVNQFIEVMWGYSLSGKPVYPQFSPDIHVARKPLQPNRRRPLLVGYDPGLAGSAWVIGQYDDSVGRVAVLREIIMEDYATDRAIKEKLKPLLAAQFGGYEVRICPDPASNNRAQGQTGASVMKELKKHFEVIPNYDNSIDSRIGSAQHYMTRLTGEGPALIIDPSCLHLKRALTTGYRYTVNKEGTKSAEPAKNKHSHVADAFSYLTQNAQKAELTAGEKRAAPPRAVKPARNRYAMR
jgi:hypothetical protein